LVQGCEDKAFAGFLRMVEARTQQSLVEAIGQALDAASHRDALGWFAHCGYRLTDQPA
jgi:hypothetical protein